MTLRAVLFDFDDCLFDTREDRLATTLLALREKGYSGATLESAREHLGLPSEVRFQKTAGIEDPAEGERLADFWEQINVREGYRTCLAFEGVREMLDLLTPFKKGIFSASMTEVILQVLDREGLREHFDEVIGRDGGYPLKPSPRGLLALAERLGVEPSECVYVGDTVGDLKAGHAAGMRAVAVTHGFGTRHDLSRENPAGIIDRFRDLPPLIFQWME